MRGKLSIGSKVGGVPSNTVCLVLRDAYTTFQSLAHGKKKLKCTSNIKRKTSHND